MNEDTNVQNPAPADTSEPQSNSPVTGADGNEDTQSTSPSSGGIDAKEYESLKRERGKLKQVQEQLKKIKSQYDNVTNWVASDADRLRDALINTSGYSPEQAEQYVSQYFQNRGGSSLTKKTEPKPQSTYVDPLDQLADLEARRDYRVKVETRQKAIQSFIDENQISDKPLSGEDLDLLFTYAGRLEKGSGLAPQQAIVEARKRLFNTDELVKAAAEEGELRGLAQASSVGSSIMSSPLGTQPKRTPEPSVPEDEWSVAQTLGFKDKAEYLLYRDNPRVGVA